MAESFYVPYEWDKLGRKERILIEFNGMLLNVNYCVLKAMLVDYETLRDHYPLLDGLKQLSDEELYEVAISMPRRKVLNFLSLGKIPEHDLNDFFVYQLKCDFRSMNKIPDYIIGLARLLLENPDVIKYIIISVQYPNKTVIDFINALFPENLNNKVFITNDDIFKVIDNNPDISLIFTEDLSYFFSNIEREGKEVIRKKTVYTLLNKYNALTSDGVLMPDLKKIVTLFSDKYEVNSIFLYPKYSTI